MRQVACIALASVLGTGLLVAQGVGRVATTAAALLASPLFFHGKQVALRGTVDEQAGIARLQLPPSDRPNAPPRWVFVFWRERPTRSEGEIRGEFWDLGRISETDGRFSTYDFRTLVDTVNDGRWPARDQMFVILNASRLDAPPAPPSPSLRDIAMIPSAYASRPVTVSGRFRGRNLYGDLPAPLNLSKWDFVLQSADAAVWVSGMRPRGKGFDLDPGARVDTGRWLEVSGTVRTEGSRVWIEATTIQRGSAPTETPVEITVATPKEAPPSVIFSAPVSDEVDVSPATTVRIQFSRDMNGSTVRSRIRVTYGAPAQGEAPAPPEFAASYNEGLRALEIKFAKPLERFQTVKVELLDGITATDGQPLRPWTLTFLTGG